MFEEVNKCFETKEDPASLDKALELLMDLKEQHPEKDIIRGKMSHAYFYKAYFSTGKEKEHFHDLGTQLGKEAITLNPAALYGNYWYGSNLGMLGVCRGIMASLKSIDPMKKSMEIVLDNNENFFFAGPHRALGRLYHQAPGWPISIGKKTKALDHLERAVELAPEFIHNRLFLSELYLDMGKKPKAREQLDWIIDHPVNPDHIIEDGEYQDQAKIMTNKYF